MPVKLHLDHLGMAFTTPAGTFRAVEPIDLEIETGRFVSLVGPSGCGKSTLFNVVAGLLPPTEGRVLIDGEDATGTIGRVGYMLQKDLLLPWRTVLDNVAFGLELAGVAKDERYARAEEAIRSVELGGFERHFPAQLSGGMRQRVGLARGLVMMPDILFLDEPFGALDAQTRLYLQEQLAAVVERSGKTVILVTHSIEEAIFLSDTVLVMTARPGRVAARLDIDLPRPRGFDMQNDPRFGELFNEIYGLLRDEVRKSMLSA